jgi:hypothetical protein
MKHIDLEPPDKLPPDDTHCKYPGCGKSFSSKEQRNRHHRYCHLEGPTLHCEFCDLEMPCSLRSPFLAHLVRDHDQSQLLIHTTRPGMEISEIPSVLKAQGTSKSSESEQSVATTGQNLGPYSEPSEQHGSIIKGHENPQPRDSESVPTPTHSIRERNLLLGETFSFIHM